MTKDEYVKMLYQRTEYLKSEIADFEQCNGEVEQARLWAIKEQVSRIFGLIDVCDKELFPDTIRCANTNEEWFCCLSTEEKAKWLENKMTWAAQEQGTFTAKGWAKWLKKPHRKE